VDEKSCYDKIVYPDLHSQIEQDQESVLIIANGREEKIRLHDYRRIYQIPGLYHEVIYQHLKCSTPRFLSEMLMESLCNAGEATSQLRILDFGAGNGVAGKILKDMIGCEMLVGVDIIHEAEKGAEKENPDVYDHYHIIDFYAPTESEVQTLKFFKLNCLWVAGALGYNDIQGQAFVNAFNVVRKDAWVVFNIKDNFFSDTDESGFKQLIFSMEAKSLSVLDIKRHFHRYSLSGKPIYYYAIVGRKIEDFPVNS